MPFSGHLVSTRAIFAGGSGRQLARRLIVRRGPGFHVRESGGRPPTSGAAGMCLHLPSTMWISADRWFAKRMAKRRSLIGRLSACRACSIFLPMEIVRMDIKKFVPILFVESRSVLLRAWPERGAEDTQRARARVTSIIITRSGHRIVSPSVISGHTGRSVARLWVTTDYAACLQYADWSL